MEVGDRSIRRVQAALIAMSTADQALRAVQGVFVAAKQTLDEAMGALADAAGVDLPSEYNLKIDPKEGTIEVRPIRRDDRGNVLPDEEPKPVED